MAVSISARQNGRTSADCTCVDTIDNIGTNNVGDKGCEHLSKADWKNLTSLNLSCKQDNLGNNNFGNNGCEHLVKAEWKNLRSLNLGINKK